MEFCHMIKVVTQITRIKMNFSVNDAAKLGYHLEKR